MKKDEEVKEHFHEKIVYKDHHHHNHGGGNAIYGLGVIGALFYFLQGSNTFGAILIGIGKAVFWPAILMFKLLSFLRI